MELVGKEEQVGVERIAMENVNEDELESVRKAKKIYQFSLEIPCIQG